MFPLTVCACLLRSCRESQYRASAVFGWRWWWRWWWRWSVWSGSGARGPESSKRQSGGGVRRGRSAGDGHGGGGWGGGGIASDVNCGCLKERQGVCQRRAGCGTAGGRGGSACRRRADGGIGGGFGRGGCVGGVGAVGRRGRVVGE